MANKQTSRASKRTPQFACMECGKKFYSVQAAERASFGDSGCPGCGGCDIDIYLDRSAERTTNQ